MPRLPFVVRVTGGWGAKGCGPAAINLSPKLIAKGVRFMRWRLYALASMRVLTMALSAARRFSLLSEPTFSSALIPASNTL